jgi:hypothetical protein
LNVGRKLQNGVQPSFRVTWEIHVISKVLEGIRMMLFQLRGSEGSESKVILELVLD